MSEPLPILDLCPACGRVHVTSAEGAACETCDPGAHAKLLVRVACPKCGGEGAREGEPWCVRCDGDGLIGRTPTPADLLTDPRVRALVAALDDTMETLELHARRRIHDAAVAALAPFHAPTTLAAMCEEVPDGE